jgi:hypothetical protein
MWSIFPAAAMLLAQGQPDPAGEWCFERGQGGAKLCERTENACNTLLKINPEIATGPCLRVEPNSEQSGSTTPPSDPQKRRSTKP